MVYVVSGIYNLFKKPSNKHRILYYIRSKISENGNNSSGYILINKPINIKEKLIMFQLNQPKTFPIIGSLVIRKRCKLKWEIRSGWDCCRKEVLIKMMPMIHRFFYRVIHELSPLWLLWISFNYINLGNWLIYESIMHELFVMKYIVLSISIHTWSCH